MKVIHTEMKYKVTQISEIVLRSECIYKTVEPKRVHSGTLLHLVLENWGRASKRVFKGVTKKIGGDPCKR